MDYVKANQNFGGLWLELLLLLLLLLLDAEDRLTGVKNRHCYPIPGDS